MDIDFRNHRSMSFFCFFKENGKFVDIGESRIDWML